MTQPQSVEEPAGPPGLLTLFVGVAMVAVDVAVVYALLATGGIPAAVVYGGTALVAIVVGGSFLAVVARRFVEDVSASTGPSTLARAARVVVSITVLTGVTALLGYGGGLVLALSAAVGGPDPEVADGERLRDRLLDWPERNREFMRTNGYGELPLRP